MSNRIPIEINPGLVSDLTDFSVPGTYKEADHIRFWENKAQSTKGRQKVSEDFILGVTRNVLPFKDNIGSPFMVFGSHTGLEIWSSSGNIDDITPATFVTGRVDGQIGPGYGIGFYGAGPYGIYVDAVGNYQPTTWSLDSWGQDVIATPSGGAPYLWHNNGNAVFTSAVALYDLANDATSPYFVANNANNVAHIPHVGRVGLVAPNDIRQYILFATEQEYAANGTVGGPYNPLCIRGSDIGGNITDWAVKTDNNAFEDVLPSGGFIVGACVVGTQVAVWTQTGLYIGDFLGTPQQTWSWKSVGGALGLLGPNAMCSVASTLFWISPDFQIWTYTIGDVPKQIPCPIRDDTIAQCAPAQDYKVTMGVTQTFGEIRIDYPDRRDDGPNGPGTNIENSRYLTLSLQGLGYSRGIESRTAYNTGAPYPNPISVFTETVSLPYQGAITDNASAANAISSIQLNLSQYGGSNLVSQSMANGTTANAFVTPTVGNTVVTGQSGWGVRMVSNGNTNTHQFTISNLGLVVGDRVSLSYKAQVTIGGQVTVHNTVANATVSNSTVLDLNAFDVLDYRFPTIVHNNIIVTSNAEVATWTVNANATTFPKGTTVEFTDFMIQKNSQSTNWLPAKNDPNLFTRYTHFILSIEYPQIAGTPLYEEFGDIDENDNPIAWSLLTNDFPLDEDNSSFEIQSFIPDFKKQIYPVQVTIISRDYPQGPIIQTIGPLTVKPGDTKIDFRATGKIHAFKIEGTGPWAMGKPMVDVVKRGNRY